MTIYSGDGRFRNCLIEVLDQAPDEEYPWGVRRICVIRSWDIIPVHDSPVPGETGWSHIFPRPVDDWFPGREVTVAPQPEDCPCPRCTGVPWHSEVASDLAHERWVQEYDAQEMRLLGPGTA